MRKSKTLIDQIVTSMTSQIKAYKPRIGRVIENQEVYDVLVTLEENSTGRYAPKEIAFSYAVEAGYFIDIDDITWEFGYRLYPWWSVVEKCSQGCRNCEECTKR